MAFTSEVSGQLKYYVYRLIDPRNGETFYVGKGKGNRIFQHIAEKLDPSADKLSEKLQRIHDIKLAGLEVGHVIHRHGLDQAAAFEVEAALIDAYPGVTNTVTGHGGNDRGVMHADEITARYQAPIAEFKHRLVIININQTASEQPLYEAVRYAWKLDPKKAGKADYVLAVVRGLIVGAFDVDEWLKATPENFPGRGQELEGRWGFVGKEAHNDVWDHYRNKRLPDEFRKKGAANPIRYVGLG